MYLPYPPGSQVKVLIKCNITDRIVLLLMSQNWTEMSLIQLLLSTVLEYNLSILTPWMVQLTNVLAYHLSNRGGDLLI